MDELHDRVVNLATLFEELEHPDTNGSRVLDARIALEIEWPGLLELINGQTALEWMGSNPAVRYEEVAKHWGVPPFTTDFEAAQIALTGDWNLRSLLIERGGIPTYATVETGGDSDSIVADAATPPLAISAAALRALATDLALE